MSPPFISVIIPAFNREHFVARAVTSVLHQTYPHLEVIVVDDGSTDGTVAALAPFAGKIQLLRQPNRGVSTARNLGIRAARGPWIAFLDSDDWWKPAKLERQVQLIQKYGVSMCFTRCETDNGELWRDLEGVVSVVKEPGVHWVDDAAASVCLARHHPYIQTLVVEKQLLEKVGLFNESLSNGNDTQILFRLSFYGGYLYLDEPLAVVQIGTENSLTTNQERVVMRRRLDSYLRVQAEMYWRLVLKNPRLAAVSRQRLAYYCLRRAQLACATGDYGLTRALGRHVRILAGDPRMWAAGAALQWFPRWLAPLCREKIHLT
jgi:glycosyltransferase involved in cell wall biosynthesis